MKRHLLFFGLLAGGWLLTAGLNAQDPITAAAEREQAEERYRTMNTRITQLEEALQSYQKRLSTLRDENGKLRDEIDRLKSKGESTATLDTLKHLAEKIEEVDKKRRSDGESIASKFDELRKLLLDRPARVQPKDPAPPAGRQPGVDAGRPGPEHPPGGREVGFEYAVQGNDTLSGIVAKLRTRDDFKKLTPTQLQKQIMDANPGVNWNKLKINHKLFIPAPPS